MDNRITNKKINKKMFLTSILFFVVFLLCLGLLIFGLTYANIQHDDIVLVSTRATQVGNDSTKFDLPSWVTTIITCSIWVVIAIFSIGIVVFACYIIVYFIKRNHGKQVATIEEKQDENDNENDTPSLVRLTLGEKVIEDGQQQQQ